MGWDGGKEMFYEMTKIIGQKNVDYRMDDV